MVKNIETWVLVLGLINLFFLIVGYIFFLPKKKLSLLISEVINRFPVYLPFFLIILCIGAVHLIEVNLIDTAVTHWVGTDYAINIHSFEGDRVLWFALHWTPMLVYFFVFIYIGVHLFTLWFSPLFFFATNEKRAMKTFVYGLLMIYAMVLPFYLFFPITNVYSFYNLGSSLEHVIPNVNQFFYFTTTHNNSFPSLHVALTLLIARSASLTKNKRYKYFTYFTAGAVILSVMYLAIHWITDVIGGIIIAGTVFFILGRFLKEEKP